MATVVAAAGSGRSNGKRVPPAIDPSIPRVTAALAAVAHLLTGAVSRAVVWAALSRAVAAACAFLAAAGSIEAHARVGAVRSTRA